VEIARADNVLRVPNSALRLRPSAEALAALGRPALEERGTPAEGGHERKAVDTSGGGAAQPHGDVWVMVEGQLTSIPVRIGITDGTRTAVFTRALVEGTPVVTSISDDVPVASTTSTSPLLPSFRGRGAGGARGARNPPPSGR
jgi:hypothetical protein